MTLLNVLLLFGGLSYFIASMLVAILYLLFNKTRAAGMLGVNGCDKVPCPLGSRNTVPFCA